MLLKFSKDFQLLLERISKNKVAEKLLSLKDSDKPFNYNFISIGGTNNLVSFTPIDKVDKAISSLPTIYTVNCTRNLTHSSSNNTIFERLGYNPNNNEYWYPTNETDDYGVPYNKGHILSETKSNVSENVYVLYQCIRTNRLSVVNKEALVGIENTHEEIYNLNRNTLRIGRLVTHFLNVIEFDFCEKDIEVFVNLYKASYDFTKNGDKQFQIVSGDEIKKWYKNSLYSGYGIENGNRGVLNNSCMGDKGEDFFDIYSKNSVCSMLILYSDNGILNSDGSYVSDKIKGRCLLWDVDFNGKKIKMLDRIYTNYDSDIDLFKNYAIERGWYFKESQSMDPNERISNNGTDWEITDNQNDGIFLKVELNHRAYRNYPYMDTFCYWLEEDGKVFLINQRNNKFTREFRTTGGQYCIYHNYDHTGYGPTDEDYAEYDLSISTESIQDLPIEIEPLTQPNDTQQNIDELVEDIPIGSNINRRGLFNTLFPIFSRIPIGISDSTFEIEASYDETIGDIEDN